MRVSVEPFALVPLQGGRTDLLAGQSLQDRRSFWGRHFRNQQRGGFPHSTLKVMAVAKAPGRRNTTLLCPAGGIEIPVAFLAPVDPVEAQPQSQHRCAK
jgi:hypothetical protein